MTTQLPRERLYARLDGMRAAPIALIVADDGLGKSTLIRDYLESRAIAHLRFTARTAHAGAIARALEQSPDGTATIVLDELHALTDEPERIASLRALIEAQPNVRWILAVRDAAPLPVARWLAAGLCELPIESDELRVQPDEIETGFARAGFAIGPEHALEISARTGGWPLAVAAVLAGDRGEHELTRERVYDGLLDAALRCFTNAGLDGVFELGAIGRFDGAITAALECGPEPAALLLQSGLVHAFDDGALTFYEPYRTLLAARLDAMPSERRDAILERAASALERAGRWAEAIALCVRAGDAERIAAALDRQGFGALDRGEVDTVTRALAALDETTAMRHSVALGIKAALASLAERFDVAEAWFRMAIEGARDDQRRSLVIRYGMDLVRRGRDDAVELLETESARGDSASSTDAGATLWALLGTAYVQAHRKPEAREAARRALVLLPGVGEDALRARVLHQASYVALDEGDHAGAKQLAVRALARAEAASLHDLAARALSVLFNVAMLHDGDVAAARAALLRLEDAGRRSGNEGLCLYAVLNAYAIEVDAGDVAALDRLHDRLADMDVLLTPMVSEALLPAQALRAAWSGRFEHAYDLLAPGAEKLFDDDRAGYRWAEVAVYAAAAGKTAAASEAIRRCRTRVGLLTADRSLAARSVAYVALAETLLGDDRAATAAIADARRACANTPARIGDLVETMAAVVQCRRGGAAGTRALAQRLDDLERRDLGGVARFIGRLPIATIEAPVRRKVAG